jgi:hypothetical protein
VTSGSWISHLRLWTFESFGQLPCSSRLASTTSGYRKTRVQLPSLQLVFGQGYGWDLGESWRFPAVGNPGTIDNRCLLMEPVSRFQGVSSLPNAVPYPHRQRRMVTPPHMTNVASLPHPCAVPSQSSLKVPRLPRGCLAEPRPKALALRMGLPFPSSQSVAVADATDRLAASIPRLALGCVTFAGSVVFACF